MVWKHIIRMGTIWNMLPKHQTSKRWCPLPMNCIPKAFWTKSGLSTRKISGRRNCLQATYSVPLLPTGIPMQQIQHLLLLQEEMQNSIPIKSLETESVQMKLLTPEEVHLAGMQSRSPRIVKIRKQPWRWSTTLQAKKDSIFWCGVLREPTGIWKMENTFRTMIWLKDSRRILTKQNWIPASANGPGL